VNEHTHIGVTSLQWIHNPRQQQDKCQMTGKNICALCTSEGL